MLFKPSDCPFYTWSHRWNIHKNPWIFTRMFMKNFWFWPGIFKFNLKKNGRHLALKPFSTVFSSFLECFQNETIQNLLHFYLSFWLGILCSSKPFSFPFPFVHLNTILVYAHICKYVCVLLPLIGKWQLFLVRQKGVKSSTLMFLFFFFFIKHFLVLLPFLFVRHWVTFT